MNDAGEVLLTLYERIREVSAAQGLPSQPDLIFGLPVAEALHCSACGVTSHQTSYTQYFFNVAATALRQQAARSAELRRRGQLVPRTMGGILRAIEDSTQKSCDTDVGGCNRRAPVTLALERAPRVFTLQLAWESNREEPRDIRATMQQVHAEVSEGSRGTVHVVVLCALRPLSHTVGRQAAQHLPRTHPPSLPAGGHAGGVQRRGGAAQVPPALHGLLLRLALLSICADALAGRPAVGDVRR